LVAAYAVGGNDNDSGLPSSTEWNSEWDHDVDSLRSHLQASYEDEAQYYADSDMPSDVEFTGIFEDHAHHHAGITEKVQSPLHASIGFVEDLLHSCKDAFHWRPPTGFPFHHFPAHKATTDLFSPSKEGTQ
jgi:hypothetical protein